MTEKKKRPWLIPAILAVAAVAVVVGLAVYFSAQNAPPDPYTAACEAVDSFPSLPNPATLGVLGQGEVDGARFGVSGNLNLQTDGDGLSLSLTDFTLADEDGSTDIEVNINKDAAAVRLPGMLGEGWYGVDLTKPLKTQAAQAAGEELADWYLTADALEEAQTAVDELRAALAQTVELGLSEADRTAVKDFIAAQDPAIMRDSEGGGYHLTILASAEDTNSLLETLGLPQMSLADPAQPLDEPENVDIFCTLDKAERLVSVEVTSDDFSALLDLGDPDDPSPRLELEWGENRENSLELAFTIAEGEAVAMRSFENAFGLLQQLVGE